MASSKAWLLLLQVIHALIELYNSFRRNRRVDAVRSDPGSEWLRKFGGTDERDKSGSDTTPNDPGGKGDG